MFAILLFVFVALALGKVEVLPRFIRATLSLIALGFSCYFWHLASNIAEPYQKKKPFLNAQSIPQRVVNVGGSGTYNESVQIHGDLVQGDKNIFNNFNFNQDVAGAIQELEKLLKQLEKQLGSPDNAQQEAVQELYVATQKNPEIKSILYEWLKILEISSVDDEIDAAEKLVAVASRRQNSSKQSIFQLDKRFRRLEYLLKSARWHEADDETVRVIAKLMPDRSKHRCTQIDVSQIPPRALKTINRLWLETSAGRFGFSVQKRIWQRIKNYQYRKSQLHQSNYEIFVETDYEIFVEAVGWSNEAGRIYYVDFDYLITNPKGHLPMKVLLWETYDPKSNYCYLSHCLFDEFMEREYSNVSFLPDWLREWLLLD